MVNRIQYEMRQQFPNFFFNPEKGNGQVAKSPHNSSTYRFFSKRKNIVIQHPIPLASNHLLYSAKICLNLTNSSYFCRTIKIIALLSNLFQFIHNNLTLNNTNIQIKSVKTRYSTKQIKHNRYKHPFYIFTGYRISMKREILYQKIAGTIAWQIDTTVCPIIREEKRKQTHFSKY